MEGKKGKNLREINLMRKLNTMKFIPLSELLLPDNEKIKELNSIYQREVEYLDFLGPIEFYIANYGINNSKLKDVDVVIALRNIRNHLDKDLGFFKNELEYNLVMTINASLQFGRKITKHELTLVIKNILWAIDNRGWLEDKRAYIDWIANFFHLLDGEEKRKFDDKYENLGREYGLNKEKLKQIKGEDTDFEFTDDEAALSKLDSEDFEKNETEEKSFWSPEAYVRSISSSDMTEEKMKYFGGDPADEPKEYICKKCKTAIGKHNLYWHEGMCDNCFFNTHSLNMR